MLYEDKYQSIYNMREQILNGTLEIDPELLKEYDERAAELTNDPDYKDVEATAIDVKDI